MAEEIIKVYWSATAQKSFDNIIAYLGAEWTEKEIQKICTTHRKCISSYTTLSRNEPTIEQKKECTAIYTKQAYKTGIQLSTKKEANNSLALLEYETEPGKL